MNVPPLLLCIGTLPMLKIQSKKPTQFEGPISYHRSFPTGKALSEMYTLIPRKQCI